MCRPWRFRTWDALGTMPPRKKPSSRDVDVDGVPCHVTKYTNRTLVVIGTDTVNRGTFDLKSAMWTDDYEAIRTQARAHKKFAGIAAARGSSSFSALATRGARLGAR